MGLHGRSLAGDGISGTTWGMVTNADTPHSWRHVTCIAECAITPSNLPHVPSRQRRFIHGSTVALAIRLSGPRQPCRRVMSRCPFGKTVWAVATMRVAEGKARLSRRIQRGKPLRNGLMLPKRPYSCCTCTRSGSSSLAAEIASDLASGAVWRSVSGAKSPAAVAASATAGQSIWE